MKDYTLSHVTAVLQRAGYSITERQLRDWVDKGVLPHPVPHGKGRGKGKVYCWKERTIIKQAATVWELLCWYGRMRTVPFMLWLLGYEVPLSVVRQELLRWVDGDLEQILEGVDPQDGEQLADRLSALAVQAHQRGRRKKGGRAAQEELLELYLNVQLNPQYRPSETVLRAFVQELGMNRKQPADQQGKTMLPSEAQMDQAQSLLQFLQQHLSHASISQAVATASDTQLQQTRNEFGRMLQLMDRLVAHRLHDKNYWPEFKYNLLGNLGQHLIPWMLTLKCEGYGQWIDLVLEWVEVFEASWQADPLFRHAIQRGDLETAITRLPLFANAEESEHTRETREPQEKGRES